MTHTNTFLVYCVATVIAAVTATETAANSPSMRAKKKENATPPAPKELTDQALLLYALSTPFDFSHRDRHPRILGLHKGIPVVTEVRCSDFCQANTVRIIYYDLPANSLCEDSGGKIKEYTVPVGIGIPKVNFCFPDPIADNWEQYNSFNGIAGATNPAIRRPR